MSHTNNHTDSEGKTIASGGVVGRKETSYSEYDDIQWSINQPTGFGFSNSSRILKFELRRPPKNERIEDLVIEWTETNPSAVNVTKLPTFFNCIDSMRVLLNNKEVVDYKAHHGIKVGYRDGLYTRFKTKEERDRNWNWTTGQDELEDAAGMARPFTIAAGGTQLCYATFANLLPGVFDNLNWGNLFLCEIEITLVSDFYLIGDVVESLQVTHDDIRVFSRHKKLVIPTPKHFSNHTLYHPEYEVLKIGSGSPLHFGGTGTMNVDLHTFIPRRPSIQRIHVFVQGDGVAGPIGVEAYRELYNDWVGRLTLERNGDTFQATEFFYNNRRQIAYQVQKYFKRHHGGCASLQSRSTGILYGRNMSEIFIDCTTVSKTVNPSPVVETKVKASEGIDNMSNLNLIIECNGVLRAPLNTEVIVVVEWQRYDRINPSGNVIRISTP